MYSYHPWTTKCRTNVLRLMHCNWPHEKGSCRSASTRTRECSVLIDGLPRRVAPFLNRRHDRLIRKAPRASEHVGYKMLRQSRRLQRPGSAQGNGLSPCTPEQWLNSSCDGQGPPRRAWDTLQSSRRLEAVSSSVGPFSNVSQSEPAVSIEGQKNKCAARLSSSVLTCRKELSRPEDNCSE